MSDTRETDPMVFVHRSRIVKARTDQLLDEARLAQARGDMARVEALRDEMDICLRSLHEIRQEQLVDRMKPYPSQPSWWSRFRGVVGKRRA